ncbi:hypothetical protein [Hymenobacter chitinivorans]|uniref:Uncharacterized protein n=1 Tax=Hymenobacter chitinivorans DSM 11115 TaxID=1121954 RepID=A0A2M9BLS5_9BACT|nr:hypothetical protein [Hymenobacter chitinivorans]PJJ58870.1 hypothetical protein CLV45_0281 [Hymenobacter chitinivorans DSM 11115]
MATTNQAAATNQTAEVRTETAQEALYRRVKQAQERRRQKRKRIHAH